MRDTRLTSISLFSGAGGLDIGLEQAGFVTVTASDFDVHAVATLRRNQELAHPVDGHAGQRHLAETRVVHGDVQVMAAEELWPVGSGDRPDLLVGGPPCQSFSSAGLQGSLNDPRGRLFEHFVRLTEELLPRYVLFENVRGLVTARGPEGQPGEALNLIRRAFEDIGFATSFHLLNSADYGVPQRRVRLFMIGAAEDAMLPDFPAPTHARRGAHEREPWVTLGEFLAARPRPADDEVVRPSRALREQLDALPEGSGLKSPGRPEPTRPGGHWGYKQGTFIADPRLPARTVTGAATQDWVRDPVLGLRRITLREAAALQGFPDAWEFCGPTSAQFKQVGNAVPTVFGRALGLTLRAALATAPMRPPVSAPFPPDMAAAIAYVHRDDARNGHVRPRSPRYAVRG